MLLGFCLPWKDALWQRMMFHEHESLASGIDQAKGKKILNRYRIWVSKRLNYQGKMWRRKRLNYNVDSIKFRNSLCEKLWNHSRAAIFFYILPPCADNNINVQCDLNIAHFEEVETSDHILHLSDKYIALQNNSSKWKYVSIWFSNFFIHMQ